MRMKKSGSVFTAKGFMAGVLAACLAGCGGGDDGKILGTGSGSVGLGPGAAGTGPALGAAGAFGGFGGNAGMTNQGTSTVIVGAQGQPVSIGTTGASTLMTGFHDNSVPYTPLVSGCAYTETALNQGAVNGSILTAAPPPTISCPAEGTAATFAAAQAAAADALIAYNDLAGRPGAVTVAANLGGLTLAPGIYNSPTGAFGIT